jgi:hypothetical protein
MKFNYEIAEKFWGVESLLYQNSVVFLKKKKNITPLKKTLLLVLRSLTLRQMYNNKPQRLLDV